jgi:hypothetical protein
MQLKMKLKNLLLDSSSLYKSHKKNPNTKFATDQWSKKEELWEQIYYAFGDKVEEFFFAILSKFL